MQSLNPWQKSLIVGSAKTAEEVLAMRVLISQYAWYDRGILDALAYAELRVEDLPEASDSEPRALTEEQMAVIVGATQSRNEVAAVLRLVAEYHWIETSVLEAIRQAVFRVQDLPPTPRQFQIGPSDGMASEALASAIARAANEDRKDDLQLILAEIARELSNPLHPLFDPT